MTAPFEVEATVTGGPLTGHRLVVTVHENRPFSQFLTAKVQIEDRMVPIDLAAQILAHNREAR